MLGNLQVRFGGGRMEKGCNRLSSDLETGISHSLASRPPSMSQAIVTRVFLATDRPSQTKTAFVVRYG